MSDICTHKVKYTKEDLEAVGASVLARYGTPNEEPRMRRVISLGAGVQSSAMLLMALEGRFGDAPDVAVFCDTGWEPKAVYDWLELLKAEVAPFPIVTLTAGKSIRDDMGRNRAESGERFTTMPYFLLGPNGERGMGRRQCTDEYKLKPLRRYWRSLGATAKDPVECWIGISTDEAHRMKPSMVKYAVNRYPLIEANLRREDCQDYLKERMGSPAPKSACIGCPFKDDLAWARLRAESPEEFADACDYDDAIRESPGLRAKQFLHRSCVPLRQITEFRHEKQWVMAFGEECTGMCGL